MPVMEDFMTNAGLRELRIELQRMQEEITTIQGKWEEATIKSQGIDKEMEIVRAQLLSTTQERKAFY